MLTAKKITISPILVIIYLFFMLFYNKYAFIIIDFFWFRNHEKSYSNVVLLCNSKNQYSNVALLTKLLSL